MPEWVQQPSDRSETMYPAAAFDRNGLVLDATGYLTDDETDRASLPDPPELTDTYAFVVVIDGARQRWTLAAEAIGGVTELFNPAGAAVEVWLVPGWPDEWAEHDGAAERVLMTPRTGES